MDVSNVTNMKSMFEYAVVFNQDLSNWNVPNVTDMRCMFMDAQSFNQSINNLHKSCPTCRLQLN